MNTFFTTVLLILFGLYKEILSEREHKVHNIVLYPEKHSWCQITPIQQVVGSPGYDPVTIDNNVCVGACYSYSIPKTQPAEPGELIGPYCDSCQPSEIKCYHVNLKQVTKNGEEPKLLQKQVQIITNCSCQSCDSIKQDGCEITDENTLELPEHMFTEEKNSNKNVPDDIPELLEANSTSYHQSKNTLKFKNKLKKWFETYQGKIDENFMKISANLDSLPNNFKIEEPAQDHMKIQLNHNVVAIDDVEVKRNKDLNKVEHHHHKHHLGEEQQIGESVVHLIKGPHGSMVAAPVEAKLHIDSDDLKPNNEGIVINYQNHHHYKSLDEETPDVPDK